MTGVHAARYIFIILLLLFAAGAVLFALGKGSPR